jgi:hypothetical protein
MSLAKVTPGVSLVGGITPMKKRADYWLVSYARWLGAVPLQVDCAMEAIAVHPLRFILDKRGNSYHGKFQYVILSALPITRKQYEEWTEV